MKKPILIAVDPGASGATAVQYPNGKVVTFNFETPYDQKELIKSLVESAQLEQVPIRAVVEKVGGFIGFKQPGSAMFNFGENYGIHQALLLAFEIPTELFRPQEWQKGFPKTPKMEDRAAAKRNHKNTLKDYAGRLFPYNKVTLSNADALLILNYAIKTQADRSC